METSGDTPVILKSRECQFKCWCWTLPFDENSSLETVETNFREICEEYTFQLEQGKTTEYKHYQGFCRLKERMRLSQLKSKLGFEKIHLEPSKNIHASKKYCLKTDTRISGPWIWPIPYNINITLYDWQENLLKILLEPPNDRTIYWYWDNTGKTGKTTFAKWLVLNHKAGYVSGKANDIKYYCSLNDHPIYIFDFTRSLEDYVSYEAIEAIKNGIFFCGKYESTTICRPSPHIICFANFEPDLHKLSQDRWVVKEIS